VKITRLSTGFGKLDNSFGNKSEELYDLIFFGKGGGFTWLFAEVANTPLKTGKTNAKTKHKTRLVPIVILRWTAEGGKVARKIKLEKLIENLAE
jgi:hypothetical protein